MNTLKVSVCEALQALGKRGFVRVEGTAAAAAAGTFSVDEHLPDVLAFASVPAAPVVVRGADPPQARDGFDAGSHVRGGGADPAGQGFVLPRACAGAAARRGMPGRVRGAGQQDGAPCRPDGRVTCTTCSGVPGLSCVELNLCGCLLHACLQVCQPRVLVIHTLSPKKNPLLQHLLASIPSAITVSPQLWELLVEG